MVEEVNGIEFEKMRLVKVNDLNWGIDLQKKNGDFKNKSERKYFNSLEMAIIKIFDLKILTGQESESIEELKEEVRAAKEEIVKTLKMSL